MTKQEQKTLTITVDGRELSVLSNATILEAAQQNNIFIPTLCAYQGLQPFGGCRLCLVEIEGRNQFLSACTTPVAKGMVVRTDTPEIKNVRQEMLRFILSEHPSVCFFCPESQSCSGYMNTLCKTDRVTGCHNCPQNGLCELQKVVASIGLTEVKYPIITRGMQPEKYDPFYDRDYNLCILCGRCIRVCQEYRIGEVLSFQERGGKTRVGTAFERSHIEANCEFCGACVSICPTGALAEKTRKWVGQPDREMQTTCPFCGLGCQIKLLVKGKEVIGSEPMESSTTRLEQLCVKGRFASYEVLNHSERLKRPLLWENGVSRFISQEEAVKLAAEKCSACKADEFGLLISADCTNEELYLARKFTHQVVGSPFLENSSRFYYGRGFWNYVSLLTQSAPLSSLENAEVIISIGLDARYNQSVVGVKIKQALQRGAKLITIHPFEHHLARLAHCWLKPEPGEEAQVIRDLLAVYTDEQPEGENVEALQEAASYLCGGKRIALLIGSAVFQKEYSPQLLLSIIGLTKYFDLAVFPLPLQSNIVGSLLLETFSEMIPASLPIGKQTQRLLTGSPWVLKNTLHGKKDFRKKLKVLYLVGSLPHAAFQSAEFVIYQNSSMLENLPSPALVLPAAAFAEMDGTFVDGEGRLQRLNKAVEPLGEAQAGWQWLCQIAQQIGKNGFRFDSAADVWREICEQNEALGSMGENTDARVSLENINTYSAVESYYSTGKITPLFPYKDENTYHGFPLSHWVGGLDELLPAMFTLKSTM